jgi:hypothetical protein
MTRRHQRSATDCMLLSGVILVFSIIWVLVIHRWRIMGLVVSVALVSIPVGVLIIVDGLLAKRRDNDG